MKTTSRAAAHLGRLNVFSAKPRDLPVEQTRRFTLVLNLGAAKKLWLNLPQALILRVDEVLQ